MVRDAPRRPSRLRFGLLLALLGSGCVDVFVDPPVPDYGDTATWTPEGTPALEFGFYVEQLYVPLHEGDALTVIFGAQGGRWTMPAVRMKGLALDLGLRCAVTTAAGERIGTLDNPHRFVVAPDGWAEQQAIAIPVAHAPPNEARPIDDLFGREATFSCTATTEAGSASHALRVVLTQG